MKLCMIGTGYVGLVSGVCFSDLGNDVICVDKDLDKIKILQNGKVPIYEPGLSELVVKNYKNKMINNIAKLCEISKDQINIKGKTNEKLGVIGKEKAIACEVICSVIKYD
mgnify:CR=1 FL=1